MCFPTADSGIKAGIVNVGECGAVPQGLGSNSLYQIMLIHLVCIDAIYLDRSSTHQGGIYAENIQLGCIRGIYIIIYLVTLQGVQRQLNGIFAD